MAPHQPIAPSRTATIGQVSAPTVALIERTVVSISVTWKIIVLKNVLSKTVV